VRAQTWSILTQAVRNFSKYNKKLISVLEQQILNAEDLYEIYNLPIPLTRAGNLENALEKIEDEVEVLEEVLNKAPELADDDQQYKGNYVEAADPDSRLNTTR
jgi:hypothetical protein